MKKWVIRQPDTLKVNKLKLCTELSGLSASILVSKGFDTPGKAGEFFSIDELSDPFLLRDMEEACGIILNAIDNGKSICIYGDYDCDGITSTVILYSYLECMGADVKYYIPEREDGYGMNTAALQKLYNDGIDLIITVDNGISAAKEAELISELGMELVITDHHQPPEILPKASAVINPHRKDCVSPFKNLCGAGVVLKLIAALDGGTYDMALEQFSDLAAIGTIADIVSLRGENRAIVQYGLHILANTENLGLKALMEQCKITSENITSASVAFMLAPKINASGRFGSPSLAVRLLLTEDEDEALELASELLRLNNERKKTEQSIIDEIDNIISQNPAILNKRVLFFSGTGWHHGVIGIVSARITEKYGKPSFIVSKEDNIARGSARSIEGFSIFEVLSYSSDLLERFGGHTGAGGFSLPTENVDAFSLRIDEFAKVKHNSMPCQTLTADKVMEPSDLTVQAVESLSVLEPFGEGNNKPVFALIGAIVEEIISLSEGKHTKLKLSYMGLQLYAVLFGSGADDFFVPRGTNGDFMVYAEINSYGGKKSVNLRIIDYRRHGIPQAKYFNAKDAYEKYMLGEGISAQLISRIIPVRNELAEVYKAIPKTKTPIDNVFMSVMSDSMNYFKLRLCLDIFSELNLIEYFAADDAVRIIPAAKKADLESSEILRKVRCLECPIRI